MLNRWIVIALLGLLAGCVDMGRVGTHPQLTQAYFSANRDRTGQCLDAEAILNQLRLEEDGPLAGGSRRFNLLGQDDEVVAWLDMSASGKQTNVDFFYGRDDKKTEQRLITMIKQCQRELN